jgi:hypothetical protein
MTSPLSIDLTRDARAILEAGRDLDGPVDLARTRVRRALLTKAAAGGVATLAAMGRASGSSTSAAVPLAKILVPLAIVAAAGVGGTIAWQAQRKAAPAPMSLAAPASVVWHHSTAPTPAPAPRATERVAVSPRRIRIHMPVPGRALEPADRLAEEMALLAASNAELRAGGAGRALALLNDYDRRYPGGVLREEVLATRVIARCLMGPAPDLASTRAAAAFLARHATSPLAPRVRSSCAP